MIVGKENWRRMWFYVFVVLGDLLSQNLEIHGHYPTFEKLARMKIDLRSFGGTPIPPLCKTWAAMLIFCDLTEVLACHLQVVLEDVSRVRIFDLIDCVAQRCDWDCGSNKWSVFGFGF